MHQDTPLLPERTFDVTEISGIHGAEETARANHSPVANSPIPRLRVPLRAVEDNSSLVFSMRASISSARLKKSLPSAVRVLCLTLRSKSRTLSSFSSCCICRDSAGCVIKS